MDDAEAIADRWSRECRDEALRAREKSTIGDILNGRSRHKKGEEV
jgi:hypothetical protein